MSELTTYDASWGASQGLDKSDLQVPKLLLTQAMSEAVADGKAKPGDFINSLDGTVLGNKDKPVEVIVFRSGKTIQVFNGNDYLRTEPFNAMTAAMLYDKSEGDMIHKHVIMNFSCLLPKDIKDGAAFPIVTSFKKTSLGAGKKLSTLLIKLDMMKKPSAAKTFLISCNQQENDKGKFFVMDVSMGRDTTSAELEEAKIWFMLTERKNQHEEA